jgi:hypothetical protein
MLSIMKPLLIIACVLFATSANADIFQKVGGDCPSGSYSSGDYCKTFTSTDKRDTKIIANTSGGRCPTGWYRSGDYCKAYGSRAAEEDVVERVGDSCPTGTYKSGGFCKSYN